MYVHRPSDVKGTSVFSLETVADFHLYAGLNIRFFLMYIGVTVFM